MHIAKTFKYTLVLLLLAFAIFHFWMASEVVVISQPSLNKQHIAQIMMKREFPYFSVQSYLVIRNSSNGSLIEKHFLMARDEYQDIVKEISALKWEGEEILVNIQSSHYSGPSKFQVRSTLKAS